MAACLLLLGACAETQLAVHVAKEIQRHSGQGQGRSEGTYKVGKPYQVQGVWYYPRVDPQYDHTGIASWYGQKFHGRLTANGETYDMNTLTAAHKTLPMPTRVQVTNLANGRSLILKVNDRGPFVNGRIIDVSRRAAQLLGFYNQGTAKVRVTVIDDGAGTMVASKPVTPKEQRTALPALPRGSVTAQSLAPPSGIKQATPSPATAPTPVRVATAGGQSAGAGVNGSLAAVSQEAVKPSTIYVQAGAFALAENAAKLRARLAYIGPANVTNIFVKGQEIFRVRLGPIFSVEAADKVLRQVLGSGVSHARIIVE
ncbi:MAG: septal ring lytic transglycosylase RlpA family protein [Alphaproteobacteria bacterium]|jgi:rare lipoprotein A|nr:septal ring lytic transglycosylase RlpA family protein [Alphaproteobacteria bacterium]MDP6564910.1 septal ring lytic transglycosylase RlpA family protein [Alphaproteobacteria bacterium]